MPESTDLPTALVKIVGHLPDYQAKPGRTALLIIDMQYLDAHRAWGFGAIARELGLSATLAPYFDRIERVVVPNLVALAGACRQTGTPVIHTHIAPARPDGSDLSLRYRLLGVDRLWPAGTRETQILDELAPQPGDVVLPKTTQNVFLSTDLDAILRGRGVEYLIIGGVTTGNCVEAAARTAIDLGYRPFVVEDATAAFTDAAHKTALRGIDGNFAHVRRTAQLLEDLE